MADDLDSLIALESLTGHDLDDAMVALARLIDGSDDAGRLDGLEKAIRHIEELLRSGVKRRDEPLLYYFAGNAWGGIRRIRRDSDTNVEWLWEDPYAREEILAFRRSFSHERFAQLGAVRRCQIATNLGNLMSNLGRFVDALGYYDTALSIDPHFGMAVANRADCLLGYARALYDHGHQGVFANAIAKYLERALSLRLEPGTAPHLRKSHEYAAARASKSIDECDNGGSFFSADPTEKDFQLWALRERLYLNPLNDLGPYSVAARDVLLLPTMNVKAEHGSGFHGFFNQLKQEFVAARWFLYEGLKRRSGGRHIADKEVRLLDTGNDSLFGIGFEQVKFAFRVAYSLLDKIAVFLALYFEIEKPIHKIGFRNVWYVKGKPCNGLLPVFENRHNWPLRGLFWLSKDLHDWNRQYHEAIEPKARHIAKIRNQLEHQYVRVVERRRIVPLREPLPIVPPDPFGMSVSKADLEAKALWVLKTARAALINLSLAIHDEELQKAEPPSDKVYRGEFPVMD